MLVWYCAKINALKTKEKVLQLFDYLDRLNKTWR